MNEDHNGNQPAETDRAAAAEMAATSPANASRPAASWDAGTTALRR